MLVPATTVPVTIIGAFAAMAALGFTVNFSTLFAIVLAIGIVVDDAIVVVEGAVAQYREGHDPDAMRRSPPCDELFGPIIGITLVLMSVFLPAAFLPATQIRVPVTRPVCLYEQVPRDERQRCKDATNVTSRAVASRLCSLSVHWQGGGMSDGAYVAAGAAGIDRRGRQDGPVPGYGAWPLHRGGR